MLSLATRQQAQASRLHREGSLGFVAKRGCFLGSEFLMITGSPTAERLNTGIKSKRGDRAKRRLTHYSHLKDRLSKGSPSLTEFKVVRYLTGMVERSIDNAYGGTEKRMVLTVIDCVSDPKGKANNRTGPRKLRYANSVRHDGMWTVPSPATKVVRGKATTKAKAPRQRKGFTVTIGEDGCANVSVRSHLFVHGYTAKNKHSVDAPDINSGMFDSGAKVVNNNAFELVKIDLDKIGRTKFHNATAIVWNPESRVHKRIVLPRVRNKKEAIVALRTIHNIEC